MMTTTATKPATATKLLYEDFNGKRSTIGEAVDAYIRYCDSSRDQWSSDEEFNDWIVCAVGEYLEVIRSNIVHADDPADGVSPEEGNTAELRQEIDDVTGFDEWHPFVDEQEVRDYFGCDSLIEGVLERNPSDPDPRSTLNRYAGLVIEHRMHCAF